MPLHSTDSRRTRPLSIIARFLLLFCLVDFFYPLGQNIYGRIGAVKSNLNVIYVKSWWKK